MPGKKKIWVQITILAVISVLLSLVPPGSSFVEKYYTYGVYPYISGLQRFLFGAIPFSLGDIIYTFLSVWLIYQMVKNASLLIRKKMKWKVLGFKFLKLGSIVLSIFVVFNVLWGLNYSRQGIDHQLELYYDEIQDEDYFKMLDITTENMNRYKLKLMKKESVYPNKKQMFRMVERAYFDAADSYPFLKYKYPSIKSSLYGRAANYWGFTGYYNPFTGEAQVNTTVPPFVVPAITVHEVAHQIGYGMEDEANFIGFLVGTESDDPLLKYSSWFDFFLYIHSRVRATDTTISKRAIRKLSPEVRRDLITLQQFNIAHQSIMEPIYREVYGQYLMFNNQSEGIGQYDIVVSRVVAFYKKRGGL